MKNEHAPRETCACSNSPFTQSPSTVSFSAVSISAKARKSLLIILLVLALIASAVTQWILHLDESDAVIEQLSELSEETFSTNNKPKPRYSIKWDQMDYGPFFCSGFGGSKNLVRKGISIRVGETGEA